MRHVDGGYVFRQENGLPYHPDFVTQSFQRAVAVSGRSGVATMW